jgi:diguanylate cyclase (GGDEF)-like protein/PAS domain S-box-containing protein
MFEAPPADDPHDRPRPERPGSPGERGAPERRGRATLPAAAHFRLDALARANAALQAEIREHRRTEFELREAKERLALALEGSRLSLWDYDALNGHLYLSEQWAQMLGDPPRAISTTLAAMFELTHPHERENLYANYAAVLKGLIPEYKVEHRVRTRSGEWKWILSHGRVIERAGDGHALRVTGTNADITARKRAEEQVRASEQRFRDVVEASGEYVWEADAQWRYRYLSKRAESVLGHPIERLLGHAPSDFMPPGEAPRVSRWIAANAVAGGAFTDLEHMTVTASGEIRWQWVSCKPVRDEAGAVVAYRGTGANITERKRHEARIEQLATRDALTGLPNRALLADRLAHAVAGERREHGMLATMFIDVDRFKTINDSLGHHIGDALLQQMAARLVDCVSEEDTVARSGGDEFVVVSARLRQAEDAAQLARALLRRLNAPYAVEGHQLVATCSIGISLFPGDGTDIDPLLKHADTAMYHAKASGGDTYRFFSAEMNARAVERLAIENELRRALERDALSLDYQPVVALASGTVVGVEALARWRHPDRGMVPPAQFIAIAEETGLIAPLGEWALATACRQAKAWHEAGHRALKLAVNLSPSQLREGPAFARRVAGILAATGFDPCCLELELTESVLVQQVESNFEALRMLTDLGARLVVDDFGMGYSSLGYLKRLPIHGLKVDRAFVRDIVVDAHDAAIVRAIVSLARGLSLDVTAEGVETPEQLGRLRELACDRWQGFLLSPAVDATTLAAKFL